MAVPRRGSTYKTKKEKLEFIWSDFMRKIFGSLVIFLILIVGSVAFAASNQYMVRESDKVSEEEITAISAATEEAAVKKEIADAEKTHALANGLEYQGEDRALSAQKLDIYGWFNTKDSDNITSSNALLANAESRATLGTARSGNLLETIKIYTNNKNLLAKYQVRLDGQDWGPEATGSYDLAQSAGNTGQDSAKINNIMIRLDGPESVYYDIYYRVYVKDQGWTNWVANNAPVTEDPNGVLIESLETRIVPKDTAAPSDTISNKNVPVLTVKGYVEGTGWGQPDMGKNVKIGKIGSQKHLEAFSIATNNSNVNINYEAYVTGQGWTGWASDGNGVGTTGQGLGLEAIRMNLSGSEAENYDIYYRTYVQEYGWLDWTNNGEIAGTQNQNLAIIGIQVKIVPKSSVAPGKSSLPFISAANTVEGEVIKKVNLARKEEGLNYITGDAKLHEIAEARVQELTQKYSHARPDGSNFVTIVEGSGYRTDGLTPAVGENILKIANPGLAFEKYAQSAVATKVMTTDFFTNAAYAYIANEENPELGYSVLLFADTPSYTVE